MIDLRGEKEKKNATAAAQEQRRQGLLRLIMIF
jgi:hypothetical protein